MPEITAVHYAIFSLLFTAGVLLGWIIRGDRCARERIAVNAGWQERVEAQDEELQRLSEQNKDLMHAVSEQQAAQKDTAQRSRELSQSLKDAISRRDELQRQMKDLRQNLDCALKEQDRLQSDVEARDARAEADVKALRERDNKLFTMSEQLSAWQERLPPLVEKFRRRDQEAKLLEADLSRASERIRELEALGTDRNGHEPRRSAAALPAGLDACNDQYEDEPDEGPAARSPGIGSPARSIPTAARKEGPSNVAAMPPAVDDLQRIRGVGPAIERTLNELGIYRFAQIAELSEYEIERIAKRLPAFRSRMHREDWTGQARRLRAAFDTTS